MSIDLLVGEKLNRFAHQLSRKHRLQILHRPWELLKRLLGTYTISFRPGDRTSTFAGKLLRPIGSSVLVLLAYESDEADPFTLRMPLRGFRMDFQVDGSASYCHSDPVFDFDVVGRPKKQAYGNRLDPYRNPSLVDLALRMNEACAHRRNKPRCLVPKFPRILLGFAPDQSPRFEDTAALRRIAASRLGLPISKLRRHGELLLTRLLEDVWQDQLILPGQKFNHTGLVLIDVELCSQVRSSLQVFENFSELVGVQTWNPARVVKPICVANPAGQVLREYAIDATQDFCQYISAETVDAMVARMRGESVLRPRYSRMKRSWMVLRSPAPVFGWNQAPPRFAGKAQPILSSRHDRCGFAPCGKDSGKAAISEWGVPYSGSQAECSF